MFTVSAGGNGIGSRSDQFHFAWQRIAGDVTVIARIDTLTPADPDSTIGLMFRSSLDRSSRDAFVFIKGNATSGFYRRPSDGGKTVGTPGPAATAPQWLALKRVGDTFTAYISTNGTTWQTVVSDTVAMGATPYVGIAAAARTSTQRMLATVSNVRLTTPSSTTTPTTPTGTLLSDGRTALDIGGATTAGQTALTGGVYTVSAAGLDIGGTSDQFHFIYDARSGDFDVRTRLDSFSGIDTFSKAGIMVRESLAANAAYAAHVVTAGNIVKTSMRTSTGAAASETAGASGRWPIWLRLVRSAQHFTAYRSDDGAAWQQTDAFDIAMSSSVYVGLAVASHSSKVAAGATFSSLSVSTVSANAPPTVAVTTPVSGQSYSLPASVSVSATASDPEGRLARVDFAVNGSVFASDTTAPFSATWSATSGGSFSLTAMAYDADGGQATSAAVTVTINAPNQPPTVTLTSPTAGQSFTAPASITLSANASDPENRMSRVDFLVNGGLVGSAAAAPYTFAWTGVSAGNYSIAAVAYDRDNGQAQSATAAITVTAPTTNQPPTVTLTSPTNNQAFSSPATVTFAASASDPEGRLSRVDFFVNGALVGSDGSAPFGGPWSLGTGVYQLSAAALDAEGNRTASAPITITVGTTLAVTYVFGFNASPDHATNVDAYRLNIYAANANPTTATPLATSDLGKPAPDAQGQIAVDRTSFVLSMPAGAYLATVSAVNASGAAQSGSISLTR